MNDFGTIVDSETIRFERLLPGPIERVWDHLTKPEHVATWLARCEIDPRVGGRVELRFDVEEVRERAKAGAVVSGVISRFEPPKVLAYSWRDVWEPDAGSIVTFELEARGEQVMLVLTHRRLPAAAMPSVGAGWHTHLGVMLARLRREEPEPFLSVYRRLLPRYAEHFAAVHTGGH